MGHNSGNLAGGNCTWHIFKLPTSTSMSASVRDYFLPNRGLIKLYRSEDLIRTRPRRCTFVHHMEPEKLCGVTQFWRIFPRHLQLGWSRFSSEYFKDQRGCQSSSQGDGSCEVVEFENEQNGLLLYQLVDNEQGACSGSPKVNLCWETNAWSGCTSCSSECGEMRWYQDTVRRAAL